MYVIITACTAKKDDSIPIPRGFRPVEPKDYLSQDLVSQLVSVRERISLDPRAQKGNSPTFAFDLYARTGKAYKDLFFNHYEAAKKLLLSRKSVEWFFLSGLYGIIHSLEEATKYQATFSRGIASNNSIPFTGAIWGEVLPQICDYVFSRLKPDSIYVLGSGDYTYFIKQTDCWNESDKIRMIESSGSSGPTWLSPILDELVISILQNNITKFNSKYGRFTKQR